MSKSILVVDDEIGIRNLLERVLGSEGYNVQTAANGEEAVETAGQDPPDAALLDIKMPVMDGLEALRLLKSIHPQLPVIMLTAHSTVENAVEAMKLGAFDYLRKPFDIEEIKIVVGKALGVADLQREVTHLRAEVSQKFNWSGIVGRDKRMREICDMIQTVARSRSTVLISGESGTGKELIARAIHYNSPRAHKPFVAVNCATLSESLLESELFGHEKGSFTGATSARRGKFELANEGTLLLDEVSEMSPNLQARLLRVLQEREIDRVGGEKTIRVDTRILATTNRDLKKEVAAGRFREDLLFRLNVVRISFPPLRDRRGDIPHLVEHFIRKCNPESNATVEGVAPEVMEIFMKYPWPGNVRELENVIERGVVLAGSGLINAVHLPEELTSGLPRTGASLEVGMTVAEAEKALILKTLEFCGENRTRAAEMLDISIRTLRNKLNEYRNGRGEELEDLEDPPEAATG